MVKIIGWEVLWHQRIKGTLRGLNIVIRVALGDIVQLESTMIFTFIPEYHTILINDSNKTDKFKIEKVSFKSRCFYPSYIFDSKLMKFKVNFREFRTIFSVFCENNEFLFTAFELNL